MRHTHSQRLERWLGVRAVDHVSLAMRDWYGPPIALMGVPGNVYAAKGGDFVGPIEAGQEVSAIERYENIVRRERQRQAAAIALHRSFYFQGLSFGRRGPYYATFDSLSAMIAAVANGGLRSFQFQKVGTTGVVGVTNSLWRVGAQPAAGANAAAAPGGESPTDATTGAFTFDNPSVGSQRIITAEPTASIAGNTLLLYDRIFQVNKTMSSTVTEAVTGVPARYQSTTAGVENSAEGNFLFVEVGAALGATAHNWTVCLYTDQSGNTGATLPSLTGSASAIVNRLDASANPQWFAPLASGDTGIKELDQMQCSASVTGTINFVIGHPIAWMPCPIANLACSRDYVLTAGGMQRIFDDAALALLEVTKPATTATTYNGMFTTLR